MCNHVWVWSYIITGNTYAPALMHSLYREKVKPNAKRPLTMKKKQYSDLEKKIIRCRLYHCRPNLKMITPFHPHPPPHTPMRISAMLLSVTIIFRKKANSETRWWFVKKYLAQVSYTFHTGLFIQIRKCHFYPVTDKPSMTALLTCWLWE